VKLLLDTHAFLWLAAGDATLSGRARRRIEDRRSERRLSIASVWEIAIKTSTGKLRLRTPIAELVRQQAIENGIELLEIRLEHAIEAGALPHHHPDPFDRLLAAQALREGLTLVSRDAHFDAYGVQRYW
jgi:PIN domain nuclease of toxin-antitoxin system